MSAEAPLAIVLAAGASTRLGQAKQLLRRDEETLVQRTLRLVREAGARRVYVMLGANADLVRSALTRAEAEDAREANGDTDTRAELIDVAAWREGIGASLRAARAALADEPDATRILIVGIDQPALASAHLRALCTAAHGAVSGVACSRYAGTRGLAVVVPLALLRRAELHGDRGLRALLATLDATQIASVANEDLAFDIDTPADLAAARARGWIDP